MIPIHKEKMIEAREFLESLAENPPWLPYEPMLLPMLFAATRENSTASVDELTALIERSQNLAARILSLANSALYALESTVKSLRRAISILGFREVRTLVIMVGAVSTIKGAKLPRSFNATALWRHQIITASIAKALSTVLIANEARITDVKDRLEMQPDEAYAAGLLHDIGKVFLAAGRPKLWEAIDEIRQMGSMSFCEAENQYWGMDHALIGAQVLHSWKLPLMLTDPISWHHAPEMAPAFSMESRLLAASNMIAHSGLTSELALHEDAIALLPKSVDPAELASAVAQCLECANENNYIDLLNH